MAVLHDGVEIEDFQYDKDLETYFYPCLCGGNFCIPKIWRMGKTWQCVFSLIITVIYDKDPFMCGVMVPALSTHKELVKC
uniref:DPH-type MB domain-containing protein n=1 Tax=Suricata suricatta TaxID=37032 RepID=A0A673VFE8_SURSU